MTICVCMWCCCWLAMALCVGVGVWWVKGTIGWRGQRSDSWGWSTDSSARTSNQTSRPGPRYSAFVLSPLTQRTHRRRYRRRRRRVRRRRGGREGRSMKWGEECLSWWSGWEYRGTPSQKRRRLCCLSKCVCGHPSSSYSVVVVVIE